MKKPLAILLVAVVALVAALGLWLSTQSAAEGVAPAQLSPEPAAEPEAPARSTRELEGERAREAELPAAREAAALPQAEPRAREVQPAEVTLLEATFVDEVRAPIARVQATVDAPGGRRSAESGADGMVRFQIPLKRESADVTLRASADGCAGFYLRTRLERGQTARLGDLVMHPGGEIAGVVLGPEGAPFEGARVSVGEESPPRDPDAARVTGPDLPDGSPSVKSGATGAFRIDGIPVRGIRLWATAAGMRHTSSDPIEILPRGVQGGVILRLEALARDERIEGIVEAPDGQPVAKAQVRYSYSTGDTSHMSNLNTGVDGRFRILAPKKVPFGLRASDPDKRWQEASRADVAPGTLDIVLQLREPRWIELAVVAGSKPVLEFSANVVGSSGTHHITDGGAKEHADGRERLIVPVESFRIMVTAPGHAIAELGPFDPDSAPSSVVAELELLPGLHGRVLAQGKPVSGARLELHQVAARGAHGDRIVHNGYPTRFQPRSEEFATSGEDGHYRFTARAAGEFAILCIAEGHALAELGPIAVVPAKGASGLDFALVAGGSIEGRVLVPAGQDPAGIIVAANRGDARARTLRTGADGAFRFAGLTPGDWNVKRAQVEISTSRTTTSVSSGGDDEAELPWNCVVEDGRATRFDIDLRDAVPCSLLGRVEVNHAPAVGWSVHVTPELGIAMHEPPGGRVDAKGDVRLEIPEPGTYRIALRPPPTSTTAGEFSAGVSLAPGPNPWQVTLEVGALEASGGAPGAIARYTLDAQLVGDISFHAELPVDEGGACRQALVPAGAGVIRRREKESAGNWREVSRLDIDVPAGGVKHVTLP